MIGEIKLCAEMPSHSTSNQIIRTCRSILAWINVNDIYERITFISVVERLRHLVVKLTVTIGQLLAPQQTASVI